MFCGAGFCGEGFDPTVSSSCNPFVSVDSIHVFCCCFLLIQFLSGEFFKLGSFFQPQMVWSNSQCCGQTLHVSCHITQFRSHLVLPLIRALYIKVGIRHQYMHPYVHTCLYVSKKFSLCGEVPSGLGSSCFSLSHWCGTSELWVWQFIFIHLDLGCMVHCGQYWILLGSKACTYLLLMVHQGFFLFPFLLASNSKDENVRKCTMLALCLLQDKFDQVIRAYLQSTHLYGKQKSIQSKLSILMKTER